MGRLVLAGAVDGAGTAAPSPVRGSAGLASWALVCWGRGAVLTAAAGGVAELPVFRGHEGGGGGVSHEGRCSSAHV